MGSAKSFLKGIVVLGFVFGGTWSQAHVRFTTEQKLNPLSETRPLVGTELESALGFANSDSVLKALLQRVFSRLHIGQISELEGIVWICDDFGNSYDGQFLPSSVEILKERRLAFPGWEKSELVKYPSAIAHQIVKTHSQEILQIELKPRICMRSDVPEEDFAPLLLHELAHLADVPLYSDLTGGVENRNYEQFVQMRLWAEGGEVSAYAIQRRALDLQPIKTADNFLATYIDFNGFVGNEKLTQEFLLSTMGYKSSLAWAWDYYSKKYSERQIQLFIKLENLRSDALLELRAEAADPNSKPYLEVMRWIGDLDLDLIAVASPTFRVVADEGSSTL